MTDITANQSYQILPGQKEDIKILPPNKTKPKEDQTSGIAGTFDQFLTLLTAQLQNQDPLSPLESEQFTSQLVAFASVEQSINSNLKLDSLIKLQAGQQALDSVSLIGKDIQAAGQRAVVRNGEAKWQYNLPQDVAELQVQIQDEDGHIIQRLNGADVSSSLKTHQGHHVFEWDGQLLSGNKAKNGEIYQFVVQAKDANGQPVQVATGIFGRVSGVTTVGTKTSLIIDGKISVGIDSIVSVKTPEEQAVTASPPPSGVVPASNDTQGQSTKDSQRNAVDQIFQGSANSQPDQSEPDSEQSGNDLSRRQQAPANNQGT